MRYSIIVSRALFDFTYTGRQLRLNSVRFLTESQMQRRGGALAVRRRDRIEFFLDSSVPLASLTREQFCFLSSATRFLGYINPRRIQIWLGSGCLQPAGESGVLARAA